MDVACCFDGSVPSHTSSPSRICLRTPFPQPAYSAKYSGTYRSPSMPYALTSIMGRFGFAGP